MTVGFWLWRGMRDFRSTRHLIGTKGLDGGDIAYDSLISTGSPHLLIHRRQTHELKLNFI